MKEEEKEKEELTQIKPASSRKLKICHFSDTHEYHDYVTIPECDIAICSGDISMIGERRAVEKFFKWYARQSNATYKILVAGNHDLCFDPQRGGNSGQKPEWLRELLYDFELTVEGHMNNHYLENDSCEIMGVKIWGSPTSNWFGGDRWAFNVREPEAEELYSTIPLGTDIVITHGPAYTYGDWAINCACYVGDHKLAYHLKRVNPLLHLFGHIHESYGHYPTSMGINFFNGCICDLSYKPKREPWLLEVDFDEKEIEILNKI